MCRCDSDVRNEATMSLGVPRHGIGANDVMVSESTMNSRGKEVGSSTTGTRYESEVIVFTSAWKLR